MLKNLNVLILAFCFLVVAAPVSAQTNPQPVTRDQAINHLSQLIDVYGVDLGQDAVSDVTSSCRQTQSLSIEPLRDLSLTNQIKYQEAVNNIDNNIRFTANALRQMSEDSSGLDLASVHLLQEMNDYLSANSVLTRSLDELLIIDCQLFPEHFVAGLEEARIRLELTRVQANSLTENIDGEVFRAFDGVEERLNGIEVSNGN